MSTFLFGPVPRLINPPRLFALRASAGKLDVVIPADGAARCDELTGRATASALHHRVIDVGGLGDQGELAEMLRPARVAVLPAVVSGAEPPYVEGLAVVVVVADGIVVATDYAGLLRVQTAAAGEGEVNVGLAGEPRVLR